MKTETESSQENTPPRSMPQALVEEEMRSHHGSLRSKLVLSLAGIFFIFLMIDEVVRRQVIEPEFIALERAGAIRDANRVLAALHSEVEHLGDLAKQWASRMEGGSIRDATNSGSTSGPHVVEIESDLWTRQNIGWAAHAGPHGQWTWLRRSKDETSDQGVDAHFQDLVNVFQESGEHVLSGMTRVGNHALVMFALVEIGANPKSESDPTLRDYLVIARCVDQTTVDALRRQTQVEFSLQSPRTSDPTKKMVVWEADDTTLVVEIQLVGVGDQRLANVFVRVPRDIVVRSNRTKVLARNSFIFGSVAALLMLLLLLQRIVIGPLAAIRKHSDKVAEEGLAVEPLVLSGNDEIGELASAFDKMVHRLSDTQTQLTRASRAAGRSQVASTVIHNVGNVLTNVNSLIDAASGRVQGLRIGSLERLATRLEQADANDALLAATPEYLVGLAGSLKSDQESLGELLNTLSDNIRHIHDVIRDQQQHADQAVKSTTVKLNSVIDEAVSCCRARLDQDAIEVHLHGQSNLSVYTDRSLLLQTMINIIGNARYAMRDNNGPRRLDIRVVPQRMKVKIEFHDNGCGMQDVVIANVFDAHFTTRESGTGLGLHFCALTLKRLGGSIGASSDGPGGGSTFTIELPVLQSSVQSLNFCQTSGNHATVQS